MIFLNFPLFSLKIPPRPSTIGSPPQYNPSVMRSPNSMKKVIPDVNSPITTTSAGTINY